MILTYMLSHSHVYISTHDELNQIELLSKVLGHALYINNDYAQQLGMMPRIILCYPLLTGIVEKSQENDMPGC